METLPEFVQDVVEGVLPAEPMTTRTGWESVRFQVVDEPESALSTAAFAP